MAITKSVPPSPAVLAYVADLKAAMIRHGDGLTAEEMLAGAAQLVGNLIALQDQRKYSAEAVMTLVSANIEVGNRAIIDEFRLAPVAGRS